MVRRGSGDEALVLLHGLGSSEADLFGLCPQIPEQFTVVCYRAPLDYGLGGYAWFEIGFDELAMTINTEQAISSRELVIAELASLRNELSCRRLVLGGFSQGAMISAGVLAASPKLVDAAWLMSGAWLPCFDVADLDGKPVLVQHGTHDQVVPFEIGQYLAGLLTEQLARVSLKTYRMGHEVSYESLQEARVFLLESDVS